METNRKKSFLASMPSAVSALLTFFITLILLFGIGETVGGKTGETLAYIITDLFVAFFCFHIVKLNPKSIWYVPVICNLLGIIPAFVEPKFWSTPLWWGLVCGGWVLSVLASITGAFMGRKTESSSHSD
jgi:hypothetical protein